ncbi:MAG: hypothetical protein DI589_25655 [Shinella sp.]|jgi:hypothetical protein|nr:MAG: hypothetical protein DI589_25655 [Shinella sp.]
MIKSENGSIVTFTTGASEDLSTLPDWIWLGMAVACSIALSLIVCIGLYRVFSRRSSVPSISATERSFLNVFAIMTEDRRQDLILYYQRKHGYDREEAMRRAIDECVKDASL